MDKKTQQELFKWLNSHRTEIKTSLNLNIMLGILSTIFLILQTALIALILEHLIRKHAILTHLYGYIGAIFFIFICRGIIAYLRAQLGNQMGYKVCNIIRNKLIDKITHLGPSITQHQTVGSLNSLLTDQVENLHNFYARFLPQQILSSMIPLIIVAAILPFNWMAAVLLLVTAPLVPIFMILVGWKAADASEKNAKTLTRLSGIFLDRIKGIETLKQFNQAYKYRDDIKEHAENYRKTTMSVLRLAFLSSAVLEFFTSISIALVAVYFGFSYLKDISIGGYGFGVSLFVGFFSLILAPEFYQPLRDLGTFYHDRASAIGASAELIKFLDQKDSISTNATQVDLTTVTLEAKNVVILSLDNKELTKELNFTINDLEKVAIIGHTGSGKTSLLLLLLGFLPYKGSLTLNGIEYNTLDLTNLRQQVSWSGQNPILFTDTLRNNIVLNTPVSEAQFMQAINTANVTEFISTMGSDYPVQENGLGLSGGQIQRISLARAILKDAPLWVLDEPTASLDILNEQEVLENLLNLPTPKTMLMVTHNFKYLAAFDKIMVLEQGELTGFADFATLSKSNSSFQKLIATR